MTIDPSVDKKRRPVPYGLAAGLLLALFASLCFMSQRQKSVTVDEFSHFPSGLYNLVSKDWHMDRESPPLVKCLPAATCLLTKPELRIQPHRRRVNLWAYGYEFMFANSANYRTIFEAGRIVIILFACLGGYLLYRFTTEIFGPISGLFALCLYVFNPNVIAHSRLTTIDAGATCMFFFSIYFFWKFLKRPRTDTALLAGIALGLAQLAKFTALILYPIFLFILCILLCCKPRKRPGEAEPLKRHFLAYVSLFLVAILVSLIVINAGYLFSKTLVPIEQYSFQSSLLKSLSSSLSSDLPVPLPKDHVMGFDGQLALSEGGTRFYEGYLMGERSTEGWWYYYLVAFLVKNPVALFVVLTIAALCWCLARKARPDLVTTLCIWTPVVVLFFYFSFFTNIPIGIRFLLPLLPLLFMASAILCVSKLMTRWPGRLLITILLAAYAVPTFFVFPNYLSYFNLAAGGPSNGHKWLIDSNLDWGQDLPALQRFMKARGIEKVDLGYFGRVDPAIYGISYQLAGRNPEKGVSVISVNYLVGRPYYVLDPNTKEPKPIGAHYYSRYRDLEPTDIINHTLYVFDLRKP
jgi:hypothetical protein